MAETLRPQSMGKGALKMNMMTGREDQGLWNNHQRRKTPAGMKKIFHRTKKILQDISDYSLSGFLDSEPDIYRISSQ
jgi:hypothetical protein